jgi:superfamily I DNA/RNA helicase
MKADEPLLAITAYAGTGKTSTLRFFSESRPRARTLYLAFNRTMADHAKQAFNNCPQVETRTIHSLAFKYRGRDYQNALVSNYRPIQLLDHLKKAGLEDNYYMARILCDILGRFQMSAHASIPEFLKKEAFYFYPNLAVALKKPVDDKRTLKKTLTKLGAVAAKLWQAIIDRNFPITHNGYLKLFQLEPVSLSYDWILVDEAQDLNDCMIDLILNIPGQKVLVGDPYQQIYEWNGAVNALKKTAGLSAAYFLTRSFRCPQQVADLANQVLKLLSAPKQFFGTQAPKPQGSGPTAMIARTTFGVFKFAAENCEKHRLAFNGGLAAYEFDMVKEIYYLKAQKKYQIKSSFLNNFDSFENLVDYADHAADAQLTGKIKLVERYKDQIISLYDLIAKNEKPIEAADFVLTTAHRVKGQEFGSVILAEDFVDLPGVIQALLRARDKFNKENQLRQKPARFEPLTVRAEEIRLLYVAMTRTRGQLAVEPHYMFSNGFVDNFLSLVKGGWLKLT